MRIEIYSLCALFIKIPFRGAFRFPLLSLPGTFRDSVFLMNLSNLHPFSKKSDQEHLLPGPSSFLSLWLPRPTFSLFPSGFPSVFLPGSRAIPTSDTPCPQSTSEVPHGSDSAPEKSHIWKNLPGSLPFSPTFPSGNLPGLQVFDIAKTPNFLKKSHRQIILWNLSPICGSRLFSILIYPRTKYFHRRWNFRITF